MVAVISRGLLRQICTPMYFCDETSDADDPIPALVPAERRRTLVAHKETKGAQTVYRFDIRVQGENGAVFLEV